MVCNLVPSAITGQPSQLFESLQSTLGRETAQRAYQKAHGKAFKAWFGNWEKAAQEFAAGQFATLEEAVLANGVSPMVDQNGEPLIEAIQMFNQDAAAANVAIPLPNLEPYKPVDLSMHLPKLPDMLPNGIALGADGISQFNPFNSKPKVTLTQYREDRAIRTIDPLEVRDRVLNNLYPTEKRDVLDAMNGIGAYPLDDPYPTGWINRATGDPYTHREMIDEEMIKLTNNLETLRGIQEAMDLQRDAFFTSSNLPDTALEAMLMEINKFGKAEREMASAVYNRLGLESGMRMSLKQLTNLNRWSIQNNNEPEFVVAKPTENSLKGIRDSVEQKDISWYQQWINGMDTYSAEQAGAQYLSIQLAKARGEYEKESYTTNQDLGKLLDNQKKAFYRAYPSKLKRARQKVWGTSEELNAPFLWMFEVDANGSYGNQFKQRYEYVPGIGRLQRPFFTNLERASRGNDAKAELARAQLALYDFVMRRGNKLMRDNGGRADYDRAYLPQNPMTTFETWERVGLMKAYTDTFGKDFDEKFDTVEVTHDGKTQSVGEWKRELYDPADKRMWKPKNLQAPFKMNKIIKKANLMILNHKTGTSDVELRQYMKGFSNNYELPFRNMAEKEMVSVDVPRVLSNHFNNLLFKKHHDPLVPMVHGLVAYNSQFNKGGTGMTRLNDSLVTWADRYLFKSVADQSMLETAMSKIAGYASLVYIGFSLERASINFVQGIYNGMNYKFGEEGFKGMGKWFIGAHRMIKNPLKAFKILDFYQIETFSKQDVEQDSSAISKLQNVGMSLNRFGEMMTRGATFFSYWTDEQFNAFKVENDKLMVVAGGQIPTTMEIKKWDYKVNKPHGNTSPEGRANYESMAVLKFMMLFKGWLPAYLHERIGTRRIDKYGFVTQGYLLTTAQNLDTVAKLPWVYAQALMGMQNQRKPLTQLQKEGLRKMAFDLTVLAGFAIARGLWNDDDEEKKGLWGWLKKLQKELFFYMEPKQWPDIAKSTITGLGPIINLAQALSAYLALPFSDEEDAAEKAFEKGMKGLPGNKLYKEIKEGMAPPEDDSAFDESAEGEPSGEGENNW